MSISQLSHL